VTNRKNEGKLGFRKEGGPLCSNEAAENSVTVRDRSMGAVKKRAKNSQNHPTLGGSTITVKAGEGSKRE